MPDSEPPAGERQFVFRSGRLSLAFCATVGERWRRGFERLLTPGHLTRWYAEAAVAGVPVLVTEPDLARAPSAPTPTTGRSSWRSWLARDARTRG